MDEKKNEQQTAEREHLEEAIQTYLPAAEGGDPVAQYDLGCCYFQEGEFQQSLHWWEKAAEQGVNLALTRLGIQYAYGLGNYGGYYNNYESFYDPDKYVQLFGASLGWGKRLRWPDDYFTLSVSLAYPRYMLKNWQYFPKKKRNCLKAMQGP